MPLASGPYLANDPGSIKEITAKTAKKFMGKEAKGELELGDSSLRVSTFEFGAGVRRPPISPRRVSATGLVQPVCDGFKSACAFPASEK